MKNEYIDRRETDQFFSSSSFDSRLIDFLIDVNNDVVRLFMLKDIKVCCQTANERTNDPLREKKNNEKVCFMMVHHISLIIDLIFSFTNKK